ncbi:hypothetical protein ACTXT7_003475 [Hymenolepis weldensis]
MEPVLWHTIWIHNKKAELNIFLTPAQSLQTSSDIGLHVQDSSSIKKVEYSGHMRHYIEKDRSIRLRNDWSGRIAKTIEMIYV